MITNVVKSLLIINKVQFGYHTDSYKYCIYLSKFFNITYYCFDSGQPKFEQGEINVLYFQSKENYISRGFSYIKGAKEIIRNNKFDIIFSVYFPGMYFLKSSLGNVRAVLDIRTGSVSKSQFSRFKFNLILNLESRVFKNITIISSTLAEKLHIKNYHVLPLGSDVLSLTNKDFSIPKLLYVGTFNNRKIGETIDGVAIFLSNNSNFKENFEYHIFGTGTSEEVALLEKKIKFLELENTVFLYGRKSHNEIKPYFDSCNIGISHIPKTSFFDCQPPTKTFEYINAGMVCLATSTTENKKIVNPSNGILYDDTSKDFSAALENYISNSKKFNSTEIRKTLKSHSWEYIVNRNLKNYLFEILRQ